MQQSPCSGRHRSNQRSLHSRHHHRSRCQDVLHQNNSVVTVATTTITMPAVADDVDNAAVVVCSRLGFEPVQNLQSPTWERFCSDHPRVARAVPSASSSSPYLSSSSGSGHGATATCAGASSPPAGPRTSTTSAIGTRISPENHPPEPSTSTTTIPGDLLGRGIFNVDGNAWLFQRKMASLELGSVSVRSSHIHCDVTDEGLVIGWSWRPRWTGLLFLWASEQGPVPLDRAAGLRRSPALAVMITRILLEPDLGLTWQQSNSIKLRKRSS